MADVPDRASIGGVILAGGRGARMGGVDKAWVPFQGRALVEHVIERLQPQVADLQICAVRSVERYRELGCRIIGDDIARFGTFSGPLTGMLAGLQHARLPWVVFVPCDAPALPADLVVRLARASAGERPALACSGGRRQPVFCLMPARLAPRLQAALQTGERRPTDFLQQSGAVEVDFVQDEAFANINTLVPQGQHADR